MSDDEAIEEAAEAEGADEKKPAHWFTVNVNVEIDIANIICAVLIPPTIGALLLALL